MNLEDRLSPNFKLKEFFRRVIKGKRYFDASSWTYLQAQPERVQKQVIANLKNLATALELVRSECGGAAIYINRGYSCPAVNKAAGGSLDSQHLQGKAADFEVEGVPARVVQSKMADWKGGLGCYAGFTHLDIRGTRARW